MRKAALAALLVLVALPGSVGAGNYSPPPGDCCPEWSPKGTQILFTASGRTAGGGPTVGHVAPSGGPEQLVPGIPVGLRSPDWTHVAYVKETGGGGRLTASRVDGTGEQSLELTPGGFAWSPDSKRLAFVAADGTLRVIGVDGSGLATIGARTASMPAWSPDGKHVAYVAGSASLNIREVNLNGSGTLSITAGSSHSNVDPVWSPDSTRLAFWSSDGKAARLVVARIHGAKRTFSIQGAVTNGGLVWSPDGKTIFGGGARGLVGIELATGKRRTLAGIPSAVFSPNGRLIAFAAGGECRDRVGIYIANAEGTGRRRLTNDCRIVGTDGPGVLHGDFSRVVLGLGGNDTLYADDTYYFFDGNTLEGGPETTRSRAATDRTRCSAGWGTTRSQAGRPRTS